MADASALPLAASADGWRGIVGEAFTTDAAARLADAALSTLKSDFGGRVLVCHDGRRGGAQAAQAILAAAAYAGCTPILFSRHLPTPVATALLFDGSADVAFIVTASHNPASWNGVKIKAGRHGSVSGACERRIDTLYRASAWSPPRQDTIVAEPVMLAAEELIARHCMALLERVGTHSWLGAHIVVDGLGGVAGAGIAALCRRLGARVTLIGDLTVETFGGMRPDPTLPESQQRCRDAVMRGHADLGVILDGDGDRVVLVGHDGAIWQSQEVLAALLTHLPASISVPTGGALVVTAAAGTLIRRVAARQGRALVETAIGFKHVVGPMNARPGSVGIGAVGDFGFQALGCDRDPFALLMLLAAAVPEPRALGEAIVALRRVHATDHLRWIELHRRGCDDGQAVAARIVVAGGTLVACCDGRKFMLADDQWLLLRPSTTEGGLRLYGEMVDPRLARSLFDPAAAGAGADTAR